MIQELIQEYQGKIQQAVAARQYSKMQELLNEYSAQVRLISGSEAEIADAFYAIVDDPCRPDVGLWINAALQHPSRKYTEPLIKLLADSRECVLHESIVDLLYELEDPKSIGSLRAALFYERTDDPTNELAIKILDTLDKIDTPEALAIIRSSLNDHRQRVREEAELLLEERDNGA